jgi:hypothetical protein
MMKNVLIRLDAKTYAKLKKESKSKRVSMSRLVDHYCNECIGDDSKFLRLFG